MGRFVEDHGAGFVLQGVQMLPTAFLVDGEEALEGEASGGQTADGQGVDGGAAAGDDDDRHAVFRAEPHEALPGVGDGGSTGVRHQGTALSRQEPLEDGLPGGDLVVLVIADERLADKVPLLYVQGDY